MLKKQVPVSMEIGNVELLVPADMENIPTSVEIVPAGMQTIPAGSIHIITKEDHTLDYTDIVHI